MRQVSEELAWLYDAHHSHHDEDLPFWRQQIDRQGEPFLELGCGTGRVLLHLAQPSRPAYGLDKDRSMLKVLVANTPPPLRSSVHILQADLSAFRLNCQFPLIIMPCNTFTTLPPSTRGAALNTVHEHLSNGGHFVASLPNPTMLESLPYRGESELEEVFTHPFDRRPVQVSTSWEHTRDQFNLYYTYDHLYENGKVTRHAIQTCHYLTPLNTLLGEFKAAGLTPGPLYGDFKGAPFTPSSADIIITASRI
jgi:SAM-dependent methyltransferase